jgi:hypothetical protein
MHLDTGREAACIVVVFLLLFLVFKNADVMRFATVMRGSVYYTVFFFLLLRT